MTIKQGKYVKSVQSKTVIYQIKSVTSDKVLLKRVNATQAIELEVPKATFTERFHPAR